MVFGGKMVWAGVLAVGAVTAMPGEFCSPGGSADAGQQQSTPQNSVPDAPRPQTLPSLNTITPAGPAYPNAPAPSSSDTGQTDQQAPPSALPSSPSTPAPTTQDDQQAPEIAGPGEGAQAFRIRAPQVTYIDVPFTVKDSKGQLVPGISWRDVQVFENGYRQKLAFWSVDPVPLSVAFVIDQSVPQSTMTAVNNSLSAFQSSFAPYDSVAIFTYNNGVRAIDDGRFNAAQSARLGALLQIAKAPGREANFYLGGPLDQTTVKNNLPVDPNTNRNQGAGALTLNVEREYHTLNDAILEAAQATVKVGRDRRRVVYVISDGKEYGSKASMKEVLRFLEANNVAVYATLVGESAIPGFGFIDRVHLPLTIRDNILPKYAAATGGQIDPEIRQRGIENSFAKITEEVRTQYTAGYYTHEPIIDGKFRRIEVRVLKPGLTVIAKEGYYPTGADARPATTERGATTSHNPNGTPAQPGTPSTTAPNNQPQQ